MRRNHFTSLRCQLRCVRRGASALEVVMTAGVLLPLAGACFFLGLAMCKYLYQMIAALVGWPYP